jgi:LysR family transcriptional regulator, glycine cleavage system transcriptional activator
MPRLADFAKREPKIELRVFASSKMVDAGALDSPTLVSGLDLRDDASGVEIHLGAGNYPGYRADLLFAVSMTAVANPELVKGNPPIREPADLARHTLLHDDAMELVAGGNAWQRWLENAGVADRVDASHGPRFSSNILSLEAASQKLGVALALKPIVDADLKSGRLCAPFEIEWKPRSSYYLVCPEVIAERPAVAAFRAWLLSQV